jgi:electron transfer flavoprotein alpha subunit
MDTAAEMYADIWVILPDASALPLLGEARRLADGLGCYVHAVIGKHALASDTSLSEQAIALGADRVHVADVPGVFLTTQYPEFALFPVSKNAQAARAAQKHNAGLITGARNLSIDDSTRALLGSHPVYGGEYLIDFAITSASKFATLDPRLLPEPYADPSRSGESVPNDFVAPEPRFRDLGVVDFTPQAWRPLTKARVIVSAGRALKDAEGFAWAEKVAQALGAELAGDRSARDMGWIDEAHEVSVMGQEVAPDVYIALGIRGDTYHNAAIAGARRVIAVYPDADAPIFKAADEGIVAEPKAFAQTLLAQLA